MSSPTAYTKISHAPLLPRSTDRASRLSSNPPAMASPSPSVPQSDRAALLKVFDEVRMGVRGLVESGVSSVPARSRRRPEDDGTRGPDGDRSTGSWIWPARPPARSVGGSSARSRRPRSSPRWRLPAVDPPCPAPCLAPPAAPRCGPVWKRRRLPAAVSPSRAGRASPRAHRFGRPRFASSPSKTLICVSIRMGCKMGRRFGCSVGLRLWLR